MIKVEKPGRGDPLRDLGPFADGPDGPHSLYWSVEGRGRKSVTLDLSHPKGQRVFRELAARSDVLCENFRPGTLEGWNIDPSRLDERLVTVRISVFGQDGPKSGRPGLDRNGVAYGGLLHLTGEEDRPPVRPGVTVTDYLTALFAAASEGRPRSLALLLRAGADAAHMDEDGRTAWHWAKDHEHAECVLLARDAVKLEPSMAPAVQGLLQLCERAWEHPGMDTSDVRIDMAL